MKSSCTIINRKAGQGRLRSIVTTAYENDAILIVDRESVKRDIMDVGISLYAQEYNPEIVVWDEEDVHCIKLLEDIRDLTDNSDTIIPIVFINVLRSDKLEEVPLELLNKTIGISNQLPAGGFIS